MEEKSRFEKVNVFNRAYNILKFSPRVSWENFFIVFFGVVLATLLGEQMGVLNFTIGFSGVFSDSTSLIGPYFFIIIGIVEIYLIQKIPLKLMKKNIIIYAFLIGLAFAIGVLAYRSYLITIICVLFWVFIYIYLQLLNDTRSVMGLLALLVFILVFMVDGSWDTVCFPFETILFYFIYGFLVVIVCSIPMFIIRSIQRDPAKRELLARLFDSNIEFYEFMMIKEKIISFDNSKRNRSLISIAKEFYIANSNIQTLSRHMEDENDYLLFLDEVERLLSKVKYAILKGYDDGFEVNIGYIVGYQKTLEYKLAAIPNKNSDQLLLDSTIKNYKFLFEDLNAILENRKYIDTIAPHKKRNSLLGVIKGFNISNVNLRYSIRSILAFLMSFIFDVLFIKTGTMMTTIISAFTIKPSASNTNRNIFIRFSSTLAGILLGIVVSIILKGLGLNFIGSYLVIIFFMLFFLFHEDEQLSLIFVMMAFIFINIEDSIFVSIEHLAMTFMSMVIIIFMTNFILPPDENSNIVQLLINKINLYIKFNESSLINDKKADDMLHEISNNDYELLRLFSNIEDTYENISEDMKVLTELNSVLTDYMNTINGIKRYSKNVDLSEFGMEVNEVLKSTLARINGEEDIYYKDIKEELTRVVEKIMDEHEEIRFLKASFSNLINNFIYISELLSEGEKTDVFVLYNQDILEKDFSERFTVENIKYIITQFKYMFVVARYVQEISTDDITNFAKKGYNTAQDVYGSSVKKAYGVAGDNIKKAFDEVSDDIGEIKDYVIKDESLIEEGNSLDLDNLIEEGIDIEDVKVKKVYDIYQVSQNHMDEIQKSNSINKIYTPDGNVIEISKDQREKILENTKESRKFFRQFAKNIIKLSWKKVSNREFKTTLDKDKALESRKNSKK